MKSTIPYGLVSLICLAAVLFTSCDKKEEGEGERITVYKVTSSGASREAAEKLVKALAVDEALLKSGEYIKANGKITLLDSQVHLAVPSKLLGKEQDDEDGQPAEAQALDLDALKNIKTLDQNKARETFVANR